jgi:2-hydroxycyclohexanecarboxyl-CoA dehydrogenase
MSIAAGRVALVTGGAGGIGAAVCRALAGAGHRVAVSDVNVDAAQSVADEIDGIAVHLDVTSADSVCLALDEVVQQLGAVAVCVNAAGWDELRPFLDTDEAFDEKVLQINLRGPIRVTRAVLPGMLAARWGRVVCIASDAGRVGSSLESVYSAAKGGVIAFTKTVARETARHGVTANAVCPGPTDTPLLRGIVAAGDEGEKVIEAMTRAVPMKRLGQPEDVAAAVAYLASEQAGYVTGQTLSVSGGLTMS